MFQKIKRFISKPEYIHNPQQILVRLKNEKSEFIDLPWGHKNFHINPNDTIGKSLRHFGLYDLVVTEILTRLCAGAGLVVDVGANRGYFTSLMSKLAKQVESFEPHPLMFQELKTNGQHLKNVKLHQLALSDKKEVVNLYIPSDFGANQGIASLEYQKGAESLKINCERLDTIMDNQNIDVMKIDVEGHELGVLKGAQSLFDKRNIRFVVFEEFGGAQSAVISFFRDMGWEVFRLQKQINGLKMITPEEGSKLPLWEPPNYLAMNKDSSHINLNSFMPWSFFKKSFAD